MQVPDRIRALLFCLSFALLAWSLAVRADELSPASAAITAGGGADTLSRGLVGALEKRYPGAHIQIAPSIRWTLGHPPDRVENVALFEESGTGEVRLRVDGETFDAETQTERASMAEGLATFSALMPAWIASRRVFPGEKLDPSAFSTQEINVASGQFRDVRGLIVSPKGPNGEDGTLAALQSRQTVLEGGILLSSAVERVPDVRRGDSVRVNLVSGGLVLTVPGVAQEPAYLSGHVRVITDRTKRELVGELEPGGVVEVRL